MLRKLLLIPAIALLFSQVNAQSNLKESTKTLLQYQNRVTTDYLKKHLSALAADSMEGRETGTKGQKMAADYLAEQYRKMGLKPVGDGGTYFQKFELNTTVTDSIVFTTYKMDEGEESIVDRSVSSKNSVAHYYRSFGGTDTLDAEIVFAGFGAFDKSRSVDHFNGVDLQGKWVMVFQEIPHVVDGDTLVDPSYSWRKRFATILQGHNAEGILFIPSASSEDFQKNAASFSEKYGESENMRLKYLDEDSNRGGFSRGYNAVDPALAAGILGIEEGEEGLREYRRSLIEDIAEFTPRKTGMHLRHIPYSGTRTVTTENVAALIEGGDPELKDEVVVMTAHYDHVGIGQPDSTGDRIYNGADDDGSGTVGLLNMAKAYADARDDGVTPRRSILFLSVTGEEMGLLGSRYYSDHPIFPIKKTIANINVDMIGRVDARHKKQGIENYAYIIGGKIISSGLDSLLHKANKLSGNIELSGRYNDLNDPNQFYRRSDHWNFGRLGVPFAFFFTGVHEDYHRPGDEVHKIRFDKLANIVETMYATSVLLANTDQPPQVDNQAFIEKTRER